MTIMIPCLSNNAYTVTIIHIFNRVKMGRISVTAHSIDATMTDNRLKVSWKYCLRLQYMCSMCVYVRLKSDLEYCG